MTDDGSIDSVRRFACTACGACCNRGPEMELGEATSLASAFVTQLLFKVHSLPLYGRSRRTAQWSALQRSRLPPAEALDEEREHLRNFAARERIDKSKGRSLHLTITALTIDREQGRCPALADRQCSIYPSRPYSCRTVPMHYSRPASVLGGYLESFVGTPEYKCDVSPGAPVVFDGRSIADASVAEARSEALAMVRSEMRWKTAVAALMDDGRDALAAGLPTFDEVLRQSDAGYATVAPMLAAWRIGRDIGVLSPAAFRSVCRDQAALIKAELDRGPGLDAAANLVGLLFDYEQEGVGVPGAPAAGGGPNGAVNVLKSLLEQK
ncbi:MAG TPA: YkgJ family cysteine cluster protein [Caulobacteraceae bacterium]|jgi:Fe-S-cluster containining protein|nr:YkgJ family cysteine cluster protein [Caulobacteraceae bacterium]